MMSLLRCLTWALALAACDAEATAPPAPADLMLGRWQYAALPRGTDSVSLNAGLLVTLAIDSVDGADFRGGVDQWCAGDVCYWPGAFGPVVGRMGTGDLVNLTIPMVWLGAPTFRISGAVAGSVLTVSESWTGDAPGPFPVGAEFVRFDPRAERR